MSAINATPLLLGPEGYQISRSVRLRSSASAYFNRTPASAGSQTTWTISMWVKRGALGVRQFIAMSGTNPNSSQVWQVEFDANNKLDFYNQTIGTYRRTTQVFRDSSAWYHIVFGADTNNATAQNRFRCWVNGVEVTAWDVNSTISSGYSFAYNGAYLHGIGAYTYSGNSLPLDGYLTDVNFIDGQALTPSSFGETDAVTGVWKPKKYAGTYGTNGFYLNFSDNSSNTATTIGKDYSGNGNNWTPNNISVTAGVTYDSMLDVPTLYADGGNGRGNYAVLNQVGSDFAFGSITNGNLTANTNFKQKRSNIAIASGKWYAEFVWTSQSGINPAAVAVVDVSRPVSDNLFSASDNQVLYYSNNGNKIVSGTSTAYGATWTLNDVIGVALDLDAKTVEFYKNNTTQGAISLPSSTAEYVFSLLTGSSDANISAIQANFGQRPFSYTPPTGFKALNTQNLPEPTIKKGNQYFNTVLYTGNATARSITGVGFQPDFVWTKSRSGAESHRLYDAVRGATQSLYSNLTNAETTEAQSLTAFGSDGFSLGTGAPNSNAVTYAAWNWKESPSAGFDIVTYTGNGTAGRTISHSLGVAPAMMILKSRSNARTWAVHHKNMTSAAYYIGLETTNQQLVDNTMFNSTAPTSSVFTVGTYQNANSENYVAYLFAEVAGFSKFGSYTGNGAADGPFVFCGFRPRYILWKEASGANAASVSWQVLDTARNPSNVSNTMLYPNLSGAEGTGDNVDILSNGFKIRSSGYFVNESGGTYIFAAFAENPFKNSLAR